MAPKPIRHRPLVEITQAKRHRTITSANSMSTESNSLKDAFSKYADYLNDEERLAKASRVVTMIRKKVIVQVHRFQMVEFYLSDNRMGKLNKQEVLEKAKKDLGVVQEYIEAPTLFYFCKTGKLLNPDGVNAALRPLSDPSMEPFQINIIDYLLRLADLIGELMRLAIGQISDGEIEFAKKICAFVREIYRKLTILAPVMDESSDMKTKMDVVLQSLVKMEKACYSVHVRGSEYIPLLRSADANFPLLGDDDIES